MTVEPKDVVKFAIGPVRAYLNEHKLAVDEFELRFEPGWCAFLLGMEDEGLINRAQMLEIFRLSADTHTHPALVFIDGDYKNETDTGTLGPGIDQVLADNAKVVEEWRAGDEITRKKKRGFLVGQAAKAFMGGADMAVVGKLIDERLSRAGARLGG